MSPARGMGPRLRGVTPPFTPSGRAAILRSRVGVAHISQLSIGAHSGMFIFWRADRRALEALLPPGLEPTDDTERVMAFFNVTQTGLNMWLPPGSDDRAPLRTVHPLQANWHEAIFLIQCAFRGEPLRYAFVIYKDVDHGVLLGIQNGYPTKLAAFHTRFPLAAPDREMRPGTVACMTVSRFDELVVDARFTAEREVAVGDVPRPQTVGLRYFPDVVGGAAPLVHDLVRRTTWKPEERRPTGVVRAWAGTSEVTIGDSELEGLAPFRPLEQLPGWFVHIDTFSGPAHTRVLQDYRPRAT